MPIPKRSRSSSPSFRHGLAGRVLALLHLGDEPVGDRPLDRLARADRGDPRLHVGERQGHGAVLERGLGRAQAIELQEMQQRAERRAVDEEREEHESRRQDRDAVLHRLGDAGIAGDGERQRQRHRAAQAAPEHDGLVRMAEAARPAERAQGRQQPVEHEAARDERRHDQHRELAKIAERERGEQPRHQHGGEQENERIRPETELFPGFHEAVPGLRRNPRAAHRPDREAGRHRRHHARDVEIAVGEHEGEIGERHRQRDLGEAHAPEPQHEEAGAAPGEPADEAATQELGEEGQHRAADIDAAADLDDADEERRERDGGCVVEQALALDHEGEPARRADVAEDAEHGGGVGGGDDGAEQERRHQRELGRRREPVADHEGGRDHGDHGQQQHRRDVVHELPEIELHRHLEQQHRQEDVEEGLARQVELLQRRNEIARHGATGVPAEGDEQKTERHADEGEEHRIGDAEPERERR